MDLKGTYKLLILRYCLYQSLYQQKNQCRKPSDFNAFRSIAICPPKPRVVSSNLTAPATEKGTCESRCLFPWQEQQSSPHRHAEMCRRHISHGVASSTWDKYNLGATPRVVSSNSTWENGACTILEGRQQRFG